MSKCRYMVMGNGEVGVTVASRLSLLKLPFIFVGRRKNSSNLSRMNAFEKSFNLRVQSLSQSDCSEITTVFVCMRSYDLKGAVDRYISYIPKGASVIVLTAGAVLDVVQGLVKKYPDYLFSLGGYSFCTSHLSEGIYNLVHQGCVAWSRLDHLSFIKPELSLCEQVLLNKDSSFFSIYQRPLITLKKKWFNELLVHSLSIVQDLPHQILLLDDLKYLRQVALPAFQLSTEIWGHTDLGFEKCFEDLIGYISKNGKAESSMRYMILKGERTDNAFFAGKALGLRNYQLIEEIYHKINILEQKMRQLKQDKRR